MLLTSLEIIEFKTQDMSNIIQAGGTILKTTHHKVVSIGEASYGYANLSSYGASLCNDYRD